MTVSRKLHRRRFKQINEHIEPEIAKYLGFYAIHVIIFERDKLKGSLDKINLDHPELNQMNGIITQTKRSNLPPGHLTYVVGPPGPIPPHLRNEYFLSISGRPLNITLEKREFILVYIFRSKAELKNAVKLARIEVIMVA